MSNEFPIQDITNINSTYGPMIITSKNNLSLNLWRDWIDKNSETDSYILNPQDAETKFDINKDYFENKGGIYVFDSRDNLLDFSKLNEFVWSYLEEDSNCEIIDNCEVLGLQHDRNNSATHLITNKDNIPIDKTFLCMGNQTQKIVDIPIVNITLPYTFISDIPKQKYISIWNKDSSLNFFNNGDIKLACGVQSIFNLNNINYNSIHFLNMALKGISNIKFNKTNEYLIENSLKELEILGFNDININNKIESCNIDVTPSICPYIFFLPKAKNILSISGFSGSGSMAIDPNFTELLIKSLENEKMDDKLESFEPQSLIKNWFPPKNKQTPLSSIV